jgi:cell wall assembly regulator SMI1
MSEEQQVDALWERLEGWLRTYLPRALQALQAPATEAAIAAAERETGLSFRPALRASYLRHDGDASGGGAFPDGQRLLPLDALVERWGRWRELAEHGLAPVPEQPGGELVDPNVVQGPVRPVGGSSRWLPLMALQGTTSRYLDFDPPAGGAPGQVIEVDLAAHSWRALAPSFLAFLDHYVEHLERGRYAVANGQIRTRHDEPPQIGGEWDMPDYLGRRA